MTEYRIMGTKKLRFLRDGRVEVIQNTRIGLAGYGSYNVTYNDIETAQKELQAAINDIEDWTKRHNKEAENDTKYGAIVTRSDLHLESREVTDWEVVK